MLRQENLGGENQLSEDGPGLDLPVRFRHFAHGEGVVNDRADAAREEQAEGDEA